VLGGYDVVYIPDLKYGSFSNPLRSFMTRFSIRNATLNLPVSQYVKNTILKREPKILCQVVYNGLRNFSLKEKTPKENLIITACKCDNAQRFTLKGLSLFIECARKIPEFNFAIIGFSPSLKILAGDIPDNLQLIDFLPQHRLQEFYMKARIYCQFSIVESFSLATAEAMFFGAVPVVNNVGALSELIGNTGFLLQNYTIDEAVEKLNKALAAEDLGKMAHDRILKKFTLQNRETKLLKILSNRIL